MSRFVCSAVGCLGIFVCCSVFGEEPAKKQGAFTEGNRTVLRVKLVDMKGDPVEGVSVSVNGEHSSADKAAVVDKTDAKGVATLAWRPSESTDEIAITADTNGQFYIYDENTISFGDLPWELTLRLCPYETISGRVAYSNGKPAEDIRVIAHGRGVTPTFGSGQTTTDADGRYELRLKAAQVYFVRAAEKEWGSPRHWPLILHVNKPLENVDLSLVPSTRIHGRVTKGIDDVPVAEAKARAYVILRTSADNIELAPVEGHQYYGFATDAYETQTNDDGEYELFVGPGKYRLRHPGGAARGADIVVSIPKKDPPAQIKKNYDLVRPLTGPLTVRVVDLDGNPVPHATVEGQYQATTSLRWSQPGEANKRGVYKTERALEELIIQGTSPDGRLKGITRVDAEADHATVTLGPTGSASGVIVDQSGKPLKTRKLWYWIPVKITNAKYITFRSEFRGNAMTNSKGRFTIDGLVPGESYSLVVSIGNSQRRSVTDIEVENAGPVKLGKLEVNTEPPEPTPRYVPPTPAERAAKYFHASPDDSVADRLNNVLDTTRHMYMTPLVIVGRPDDPASIELVRRFYEDSLVTIVKQTVQDMRWEFALLALPIGQKDVRRWAKQQGVPTDEKDLPVLLALNTKGEIVDRLALDFTPDPVVAPIPGSKLEQSFSVKTQEKRTLLSFLLEHKPPTRNAQVMLDEAFATAAAEDKNVFLICSASWCGPCRMLAEFLDPYHHELEQEYVFVHLDISRDTNAQDINQKYKGDRSGGVPWYVILDAEGNELMSSNLATAEDKKNKESKYPTTGQNIGAVGGAESIEHFLNMLKSTATDLDPALLGAMRNDLEER